MEIKSQSRFIRVTPRKARLVASSVRHLPLDRALSTLDRLNKRAALYIKKTIESGIANAENNNKLSQDQLFIKKLTVDEGPRFKRWRAASRGMAHPYQKKTSHITVVLESKEQEDKRVKKQSKTKKQTQTKQKSTEKIVDTKSAKKDEVSTKMEKGAQKQMQSQQQKTKGITPRKILGK